MTGMTEALADLVFWQTFAKYINIFTVNIPALMSIIT